MLHVKTFTFNPVAENTYIVYNESNDAILIDPGCYFPNEKQQVLDYLKSNDLNLVQLLNTHCHLDHVFGNKWVNETFGLELFIHPNEEQVLSFAPQSGERWGLPFENYDGPLHFLQHNNIIKLGNDEFKVLLTPGHSPGSICFYNEEGKFIIGGDVLFRQSIGRTDLPGGNHEALLASIREHLFTLPDDVTVYSGHGEKTTIGYEKRNNPFFQF